ncbi:MAG: CBS domain-containing protein [Thermodesulfobacteriota bacterium]
MPEPQRGPHFLSRLVHKRILSSDGKLLGKLSDLAVALDMPEPEVTKLVYRRGLWRRNLWWVDWTSVDTINDRSIGLKPGAIETPFSNDAEEFLLKDFLLDKQIVDIHGAKVVRVNDLQFLRSDQKMIIAQVDVGMRGLLRRLGFEDAVVGFFNWFFDYSLKDRFIAWHYVHPLTDPGRLRLQIPQAALASLHPADLADIIEELDLHERAAVVDGLNEEVVAEALEEMDPRVQRAIMSQLEPEKAADIIEEMSPDEAADLIADLPPDMATGIFKEMDDEYRQTVKDLLVHEEDEAGGLMTTQFVALPRDKIIVDALAYIRQHAGEIDVVYYTYIVDEESRLLGVISLKELLSNDIFTPLNRIMTTRLVAVNMDDDADEIAGLFAKYGFRAIPVVDTDNRIKGVIRFKALLEILAPHLGK